MTAETWSFLQMYQHYTAGHLPVAGGFLEQPNAFTEAMALIAAEISSD